MSIKVPITFSSDALCSVDIAPTDLPPDPGHPEVGERVPRQFSYSQQGKVHVDISNQKLYLQVQTVIIKFRFKMPTQISSVEGQAVVNHSSNYSNQSINQSINQLTNRFLHASIFVILMFIKGRREKTYLLRSYLGPPAPHLPPDLFNEHELRAVFLYRFYGFNTLSISAKCSCYFTLSIGHRRHRWEFPSINTLNIIFSTKGPGLKTVWGRLILD